MLGELEGFLASRDHDVCLLVGDFNVDFDRDGCLNDLLVDFMSHLDLHACNLLFSDNISYTYEKDDAQVHSWIDHIHCPRSSSHLVSNARTLQSGSNLSDHFPFLFSLHINCAAVPPSHTPSPPSSSSSSSTLWSKVSDGDVEEYCDHLSQCIPKLPIDLSSCSDTACSQHNTLLDE